MNGILKFCFIFWLFNLAKGQTAKCDYKNYVSYYACFLDTRQSNYSEKLTRIDGQHETGHSDADVKWIENYWDSNRKIFSSIFCQKFPNLVTIKITFAELESIDEDSLFSCQNLEHLHLDANRIRGFPENLQITNSKLKYLGINNNQLTTLPENIFMNLKELDELLLGFNQISFLPGKIFHPLVKLENLFLFNNKLQSINPEWFVNLQNLKWLELNGNQISEIPSKCFASLRNLEYLYLHKNRVNTLISDSFDGLQSLKDLGLSHNEISDLPVRVFTPLTNLKELWLRNNKLTTIHSDSFGVHNQLTRVYLSNNKINAIDENFIDNTAVSTLRMENNTCSQLYTKTKSEIKPNLKKCFDNYQPRLSQNNSCGKILLAMNNVEPRMYGGTEVQHGMYPWIAALIDSDEKYFCGGTLISNGKVVTAAHCMEYLSQNITVLLGVHDLNETIEIGRKAYAVQNIHIHSDWNPNTETFDADIAVMILETEVIFSNYIQPICLMDASSDVAMLTEGIVVGYGNDEDPNTDHVNIPKSINMPIHQNEDCFLKYYELARLSSKRTFCGGSGNGTGVCQGDSGGGLVVTDGTAYYLRGIVSSSLRNMTYGCDVDTYSVFTNVLKFTDWINSISVDPNS